MSCNHYIRLALLSIACVVGSTVRPACGDPDCGYADTFDTGRAQTDSYSHSIFWPAGAAPPAQPYLSYCNTTGAPAPGLMFVGYHNTPAQLKYYFSLDCVFLGAGLDSTLEFDVLRAANTARPVSFAYALSTDGEHWTMPADLAPGPQSLPLDAPAGSCYVAFFGSAVVLDNLRLCLTYRPADIRVPDDFPTIQQAIDAADDGQIVQVDPGTYSGPGNWDLQLQGKAVIIRSAAGPEDTIIDCRSTAEPGGAHRGFYIHQGEGPATVVAGFTIVGGYIPGTQVTPDDVAWTAAASQPVGAGIFCEFTSPTIVNCVIADCRTELGGGIGCVGGSPALLRCTVAFCTAGQPAQDTSVGFGGGIALIRQCSATITDCDIRQNNTHAGGYGAGIYARHSEAVLRGSHITDNGAAQPATGGGIYCGPQTTMTLHNCLLRRNTACSGGAVHAEGSNQFIDCQVTFNNCNILQNHLTAPMPSSPASGIQARNCTLQVKNSIIWYNDAPQLALLDVSGETSITYCAVEGGYPGTGNISDLPLFADVAAGDFHLRSLFGRFDPADPNHWVTDQVHSPCIDAGDPGDPVGAEPRGHGGRRNIGLYGGTWQASKSRSAVIYHVDAASGRTGDTGLSHYHAFATINQAIDKARDGDIVLVWPGVYREKVDFRGKALTVQSAADAAVLTAPGDYAVTFTRGEGHDSVLRNFVVTNSSVGIFLVASAPTIDHVTVAGNTNGGIAAYVGADPDISNSIIWDNGSADLLGPTARYSCFAGAAVTGGGNIEADPLFADPNNGDYHLRSQTGRFVPGDANGDNVGPGLWLTDAVTSPCIDAADPAVYPRWEPAPNGGRLNMGAYGATAYASRSVHEWLVPGDLNRDGMVDGLDYVLLLRADNLTVADLVLLARDWLWQAPWFDNF